MNWIEYKDDASRTFAAIGMQRDDILRDKINQLHCVIGVSTEIAEYIDAMINKDHVNALEELGDILWYTANLDRLLDLNCKMPYLSKRMTVFPDEWLIGFQELLDHYKKAVFYGIDVDKVYVKKHIEEILLIVCGICNQVSETVDDGVGAVMQTNIDKLKARYPNSFTKDAAVNRDLDIERKILEDKFDVKK